MAVAVAMSVAETVAVADTIAVAVGFIGFGATIRSHREIQWLVDFGLGSTLPHYFFITPLLSHSAILFSSIHLSQFSSATPWPPRPPIG